MVDLGADGDPDQSLSHQQRIGVIRVIQYHRAHTGRITPDIRVIIADFSIRYAEMITRISLVMRAMNLIMRHRKEHRR
jgi:hypothetical protein